MRSLARLLTLVVSLILPAAATEIGEGPISADSRELPPPPNPPPLTREPPSGGGRLVLPYRVTFFPPTSPIFGSPISEQGSTRFINGRQLIAPEELADYVNESFYPALGTRLFEDWLGEKPRQRLEAYRATRTALLNDLRNELALAAAADHATRERELCDFARTQTPRIGPLEAEADQLREELIHGGWLDLGADWNGQRGWWLGDNPPYTIYPPTPSPTPSFR